MLSHLIRRAFGNLSSGRGFPSGALADQGWRPVARRRRRSAQRFAPSEALESRTLLTAYLVDSLGDDVTAGDNQLTLREALEAANTNVVVGDAAAGSDTQVDTITFADGLNGQITLGGTQLTIEDDVTITGLGADQLAVSGNNASRVFEIASGITAEITGLTITGGRQAFGGGLVNRGILRLNSVVVSENTATIDGGGIENDGTLTLTDSTVSDNTANSISGDGGGISNGHDGTLTLTDSTVSGNTGFFGGGIATTGTVTITRSTISGNTAAGYGGGILNDAFTTITDSTVSNNTAFMDGGGIDNGGELTLIASTVSGNTANRYGGGIINTFQSSEIVLFQSTVSGNVAGWDGGGIRMRLGAISADYSTIVANSAGAKGGGFSAGTDTFDGGYFLIVASFSHTFLGGNTADGEGDEIFVGYGTVTLGSHNLIGNNDDDKSTSDSLFVVYGRVRISPSTILGTSDSGNGPDGSGYSLGEILDPTLTDNGGPTQTHALVPGSPAINAGDENASDLPEFDQRGVGFDRIVGGGIDIGAFELQNTPPIAEGDSYSTSEDTPLNIASPGVLANDTDGEGNPLTAILVETVPFEAGTVQLNTDGSFTYTPAENFHGSTSFTYKADDGLEESSVVTVSITVNPVNDAPVASEDEATTDEDTAVTIDVLGNDLDVENDPLTVRIETGPTNGSVTVNEDGTFTYTPDENYFGPDSFTYVINDGQADSNVATVSITVNSVNDNPVAEDDAFTTNEDTPLVVTAADGLLFNDSDVDGDPLTVAVETGPAHGTLMLNGDGSFTYTPDADFSGMDSFTYLVSDGLGGSDVATVNILVVSAEDQLANLLEDIDRLNNEGILSNSQSRQLANKLIGSLSNLERDQEVVAAKQIEGYIRQVEFLVDKGILTAEEGQSLIDLAEAALISIVN